MNRPLPPALPAVVFGDLEADLWGIVIGGDGAVAAVSSLTGADLTLTQADVQRGETEGWTVVAPGLTLSVRPAQAPAAATEVAGQLGLVKVQGAVTVEGTERELELSGLRIDPVLSDGAGSARVFAGWFPGDRTLGLIASRSADAKGHDRDVIEVAGSGEEQTVVLDPRLSTTYDQQQSPLRVGIELWLAESSEAEEQHSRRIAALATGSRLAASPPSEDTITATPRLSAHALRCISRGELGAGVYVLAEAR